MTQEEAVAALLEQMIEPGLQIKEFRALEEKLAAVKRLA